VLNGETATSYLLVLNAKDLSELARAQVPHHVPFGFHGAHHPAFPPDEHRACSACACVLTLA
jgi:carotenoid cleavage dioxygenase-like enzyme